MIRFALVLFAVSLGPSFASADALPACPEGQHLVTNPVEPGAMHHAGGQCVADEGEDCSVAGGGTLAAAALAALLVARRHARRN
jgi:MYXO-CTERM domain-containing protein